MIDVDAWVFRQELIGRTLNGELTSVSPSFRPLADLLNATPSAERKLVWEGALSLRVDADEIRKAVMGADPNGPMPVPQAERFATAADVRRVLSQIRWRWDGWIPAARVIGIAASEGSGKTRFALDLARRIHLNLSWPDGQAMTFPAGTKTLWMCSDGYQDEIADALPVLGLPDDAVVFPAPPDDPYACTDLDSSESLQRLDRAIEVVKPGLVFIDTLTTATSRDLCEQRSITILKTPLVDMVQRHQVNIALLLHLSREGQALGRRIKGITRTLMHLECPNPDQSDRLRLWIEKTYSKKPPALGVTIKADGNEYDFNPPVKVEAAARGGRPPEKIDKAIAFLVEKLTDGDEKACDLIREWESQGESKSTLFRAKDQMVDDGKLVVDDSKKPQIWHLVL
jgi:hypothetical protein